MLIDDLITAAEQEASHRERIYKRLRLNDFVTDDYANARISEMVHIAAALRCLKAKGVETIQGDSQRPAQNSPESVTLNTSRPKTRKRNAAHRKGRGAT